MSLELEAGMAARANFGIDAPGVIRNFLLLALAIIGALVVIAFSGVRIALAAWRQGEDRAEAPQHLRGVVISTAISGEQRGVTSSVPSGRMMTPCWVGVP